ncbi:MAG: isoamylase early set domain-containing protein [Elusimicrobia bacterium]|nr:isoamylase early set domain-containing protein [Elusimicrobiota bacterium]
MAAWVLLWTPTAHRSRPPILAFGGRPTTQASALMPVTFTLQMPEAQEVAVVGDFNGWNSQATRLVRHNGRWSVTVPLAPGQYQYMFVVNGATWIPDPTAVQQVDDGYGRKNAVLTL